MVPAAPAKILIGTSLDEDEGKVLLSWAIKFLAHPNDTIIALHVLVPEAAKKNGNQRKDDSKKWLSITKYQTEIRQAKAFVISVMGEFVKNCQAKQINLEARVGFSSCVGRGLIDEAKSISADFLLIGHSRNHANRVSSLITRYCLDNAPRSCSLVIMGKNQQPKQKFCSKSMHIEGELCQPSLRWSNNKDDHRDKSSPKTIERENPSPRTVLHRCEGESNSTEEDSSRFGDSCITKSPPLATNVKGQSNFKKPMSPLKKISYFFRASLDLNKRRRNENFFNKDKQQTLLKCFSFEEIANATNNFHPDNLVGEGGYSEVYRGDLKNGQTIAVKRLAKSQNNEDREKEFLVELGIIGHVNHPNTANLVGCCIENGLCLIFNFYPNGTLSSALHGKTPKLLEWQERYRIACGIARGLHYLHKCCKHRIIHRDIKASNVLLGPENEPQISDFGLAKWLPNKWTHHAVVPIEGTFGYLAPEYFLHGIVDEKTDVFAFGILLLEIITGRRPVDSSKQNLLLWAKPLIESGNIKELADPKLEDQYDMDEFQRLVLTASYCIRQSSIWRPSMTEVLELVTYGDDSEAAKSWRVPKFTSEEMDDYSLVFGYELPSDLVLDDI